MTNEQASGRKEKYYISGPMTGYPNENKPAFYEAARKLREAGYRVYNPAQLSDEHPGWAYDRYLEIDLIEMEYCDRVLMLSGWQQSCGARAEYQRALELGLTIVEE